MKPMKTPGVYIVEKSAFPNSVVQVATAVPADGFDDQERQRLADAIKNLDA